jgi:dihydropteroate synthase
MRYYRPVAQTDVARPDGALALAGGWCWFDRVQVLSRETAPYLIPATDLPNEVVARLTAPRPALSGLTLDRARVMGILNVTPDSFSDGGQFFDPEIALAHARAMAAEGADLIDVGGESTRPGAAEVLESEEIRRTASLITALRAGSLHTPISIDTRKAAVARAALDAGATMVNDVAALAYDPALASVVAEAEVPLCLMHAQGSPATMQEDPRYDDVLLDVYDFLAERVGAAEAAGISRDCIIVDPGIGFGKTVSHNLALIRGLSLFHGLGCPILLGASRKRFIGTIGGAEVAADRVPGSISVALAALGQGVQILRVHDIPATVQALKLWRAVTIGETA